MTCAQPRKLWIDALRGFAITVIVLGHVVLGLSAAEPGPIHATQKFLVLFLYSFNIPIFFFVAGAVCRDEEKPFAPFFLELTKWVIWPYALWSIILVLIQNLASSGVNHPYSYQDLSHIHTTPIALFWFLYVYAFVKLANYFVSGLMGEKSTVLLLLSSTIAFLACIATPESGILYKTAIGLFFFATGKFWHANADEFRGLWTRIRTFRLGPQILGLSCLALLLGITTLNNHAPQDQILPITTLQTSILATGLAGILLFGWLSHTLCRQTTMGTSATLTLIGRYSMAIYVLHVIVAAGLRTTLLHFNEPGFFWINAALLTFAGTALPILWQITCDRLRVTACFGIRPVTEYRTLLAPAQT